MLKKIKNKIKVYRINIKIKIYQDKYFNKEQKLNLKIFNKIIKSN